jgi:hypothetical protein
VARCLNGIAEIRLVPFLGDGGTVFVVQRLHGTDMGRFLLRVSEDPDIPGPLRVSQYSVRLATTDYILLIQYNPPAPSVNFGRMAGVQFLQ